MEFLNYLITDPKYYSDEPESFKISLQKAFKNHLVNMASFRDKQSSDKKILAKTFIEICRKNGIEKTIINTDIDLALELGFYGVHLTSTQFDKISYCKEKNLYVIISCHDFEEVKKAYDLGADAVSFSPIYYTPFKGKPKGIESLKALVDRFKNIKDRDFKIFALGGITTKEQIQEVKKANADGFASIRYFIED